MSDNFIDLVIEEFKSETRKYILGIKAIGIFRKIEKDAEKNTIISCFQKRYDGSVKGSTRIKGDKIEPIILSELNRLATEYSAHVTAELFTDPETQEEFVIYTMTNALELKEEITEPKVINFEDYLKRTRKGKL